MLLSNHRSPVKPYIVFICPPIFTLNLAISESPLVSSAANVLSPNSNPVIIPAQNAIIFFNAPPNSVPF